MKISVVIPIYNNEKYIGQCIKSVLNQPYKNIEIICINDGSSDNSEAIVKNIMLNDDRIIYYFQENQGVAVARNKGIEIATGDYIAFLDSDDVWCKNIVTEKLIDRMKESEYDLISFAYFEANQFLTYGNLYPRIDAQVIDIENRIGENYRSHSSYFFSSNLIKSNGIMVYGKRNEDVRFLFDALFRAKAMLYVSQALMVYRNNLHSTTSQKADLFDLYDEILFGYKRMADSTDIDSVKSWAEATLLRLFVEFMQLVLKERNINRKIKILHERYNISDYIDRGVYLREDRRILYNQWRKNPKQFVRRGIKLKLRAILLDSIKGVLRPISLSGNQRYKYKVKLVGII